MNFIRILDLSLNLLESNQIPENFRQMSLIFFEFATIFISWYFRSYTSVIPYHPSSGVGSHPSPPYYASIGVGAIRHPHIMRVLGWDLIRQPILYEHWGGISSASQNYPSIMVGSHPSCPYYASIWVGYHPFFR